MGKQERKEQGNEGSMMWSRFAMARPKMAIDERLPFGHGR